VNGRLKPALALLILIAINANAGELQRAAADVKSLITAPLHWRSHEWRRFGEGAALVLAVGAADKPIERLFQRNRSSATDSFSRNVTPFGGHRAFNVSLLLIGSGWIFHDRRLLDSGRHSMEAELWAAGVVTPLLKRAARRERPNGSDNLSFPSGHATNAFAAATAIAAHYDHWIVPTVVYTLASGVAASRINDHVHWPSDVIAGALIGRAVGRGIVARHVTVIPTKRGIAVLIR
jgi:membrane-associated phospholipid phosphatase